jgi:hypothetical protein
MWFTIDQMAGEVSDLPAVHPHKYMGNDNFRKVVLNAILWIAKVEVPEKV